MKSLTAVFVLSLFAGSSDTSANGFSSLPFSCSDFSCVSLAIASNSCASVRGPTLEFKRSVDGQCILILITKQRQKNIFQKPGSVTMGFHC